MKIAWMPLEPFEQRYTEDWYKQFPREFYNQGIEFKQYDGDNLINDIKVGSVLDAYGTNHWKMTQLARLIHDLEAGYYTNNDAILFADLWFPGIEALAYIKALGEPMPRITGILHAGTWDPNDFTVRRGMKPWAHYLEQAWLNIYDNIFVATKYHKDLILNSHDVNPDKIKVTGLPFYPKDLPVPNTQRYDNQIVFPHRLESEKHPEEFDGLMAGLDFRAHGIRTMDSYDGKKGFFNTLCESGIAVSCATQETFGYAMLEATALGCIPVVPDRVSYREMYPAKLRYKSYWELHELVVAILDDTTRYREIALDMARDHEMLYTKSIANMCYTLLNPVVY